MRKELLTTVLAIGMLTAIFSNFAPAAQDDEGSTIDITVGSQTLIDLTPSSFSWTGLNPGDVGTVHQAQIENIGSTNLTHIWFNVTQPTSNPYGTGNNGSYDAANFVWIARETGSYYAVDRLDFNETRSLVYLTDPDGNTPPDHTKFNYGRFRNASGDYFWFINRSAAPCEQLTFWVGDQEHTQSSTGSVDFSSCTSGLNNAPASGCRYGTLSTASSTYCYADINIGGASYVIAVPNSTSPIDRVRWGHWNQDMPGAGSASNDETFYTGTLYPGNSTVANITVYLSYGVAQGLLNQGTLYVIGNDS